MEAKSILENKIKNPPFVLRIGTKDRNKQKSAPGGISAVYGAHCIKVFVFLSDEQALEIPGDSEPPYQKRQGKLGIRVKPVFIKISEGCFP